MSSRIINHLIKIDKAIKRKNTGNPEELARRLNVSERCVRNYIETMKSLGAPIIYSRKFKSYYYQDEGFFSFTFTKE